MNNSDSCMVSQIIIGIDKDYNFYSKSQGWGGGGGGVAYSSSPPKAPVQDCRIQNEQNG